MTSHKKLNSIRIVLALAIVFYVVLFFVTIKGSMQNSQASASNLSTKK